jgi:DNA sulfur modification protein DndB
MTKKHNGQVLKINALRVNQRPDVPLYVFGVNGRLISQFASVHYANRVKDGELVGYQRERVKRHICDIKAYLEQPGALLPNAIILSFDEQVSFLPLPKMVASDWGTFGVLSIPLPNGNNPKTGLIVDGQQRTTALAALDPNSQFPVVVVGFQSPSPELQREQFVLVNKTRPLPKDLLNELLPHVDSYLPKAMRQRQIAASVLELLRFEEDSPFLGRIKGLGASGEGCNMSQAAIIKLVEKSMKQGVLSEFGGTTLEDTDIQSCANIVKVFFNGVKRVWPEAWEGSPRSSRLVHGAGLFAMGALMDQVIEDWPNLFLKPTKRIRDLINFQKMQFKNTLFNAVLLLTDRGLFRM